MPGKSLSMRPPCAFARKSSVKAQEVEAGGLILSESGPLETFASCATTA